jgi:regulator of RNase E activity RraA
MASDEELRSVRRRLFGLIAEQRIVSVSVKRPDPALLADIETAADLASSVADALDQLGIGGGVGATTLAPVAAGHRVVGPAITIRYVPEGGSVGAILSRGERARLADRDLYNVGEPGDVAVFDCGGFTGASVMGGLSSAWANRVEMAACVVDGAVRDVGSIREENLPVWARAVTPVSGKHRLQAVEINGTVAIAGLVVRPGDVIAADDTGVCVIPGDKVAPVRDIVIEAERAERELTEAILSGKSPEEVARILRPERW